ncbi:hypothetical protein BGZ70_002939 [Mortierella alpina]|uniref:Carrier domain-containing protein n=1 Tax=Mortierella alpina TaxID=64518 RepID=A0A9P6ITP6_MORAP|nr:hypothetical protein BGZ70_002939 [Mortierella alpina]
MRAHTIHSTSSRTLLHTSTLRPYSASPPSSPSSSSTPANTSRVQDLVFKTVSEMLQIQDSPDEVRSKITLGSRLKADLGLDVFKTYQLLDKLEQEITELDISVEDADKAQTLEDIVTLVSKSSRHHSQ